MTDSQNITKKIVVERDFDIEPEKKKKDEPVYPKIYKAIMGDESKAANMRLEVIQTANAQGMPQEMSSLRWDADKDKGKEIEFSEDEVKLLHEIIKSKDEKKELKLEDGWMVNFWEKVK